MRMFLISLLIYILGFLVCFSTHEIDKRKTYPEEICLAEKGDLLIVTSTNPLRLGFYHKCIDATHNSCDGKCSCDGLDCK